MFLTFGISCFLFVILVSSERLKYPINHVFNPQTTKISATSAQDWSTTVPFYPPYPTRTVQVLDGNWYFGYQNGWNLSKVDYFQSERQQLTPNITTVPSAFDVAMPGILGPRGTAFYRTNVSIQDSSNHSMLVYFAACSFYCQLYIDGNYIGDHRAGGYQPFGFTIDPSKFDFGKEKSDGVKNKDLRSDSSSSSDVREIFVVVDNRWSNITAPTHTGGDFYEYGGITRNVLVHTLPERVDPDNYNYLLRIEAFPIDITAGTIDCNVIFGNTFTSSNKDLSFNFIFDNNAKDSKMMEATVMIMN